MGEYSYVVNTSRELSSRLKGKKRGSSERLHRPLHTDREIVHKSGKQLGADFFIVEISTNRQMLWMKVFSIDDPESYDLNVPFTEAMDLMGNKEDYPRLVELLNKENGKLLLAIPE
jgi:hypothetical protein